jgi:hypothetical protein
MAYNASDENRARLVDEMAMLRAEYDVSLMSHQPTTELPLFQAVATAASATRH